MINKAVDSLFLRLGQPAEYNGKTVPILVFAPDEMGEVGFANTISPTTLIRVRVSDAPDLAVGDTFECGGATYRVMSDPRREQHRLVWRAEVSCDQKRHLKGTWKNISKNTIGRELNLSGQDTK